MGLFTSKPKRLHKDMEDVIKEYQAKAREEFHQKVSFVDASKLFIDDVLPRKKRRRRFKNKRGQIQEIVFVIAILVVFALVAVVGNIVLTKFYGAMPDGAGKELAAPIEQNYASLWDKLIVMAFILLNFGVLLGAIMIDVHPAFFWVAFIIWIMIGASVLVLNNAVDDILTSDALALTWSQYPFTNFILSNLLTIYLSFGAILLIIIYGKARNAV